MAMHKHPPCSIKGAIKGMDSCTEKKEIVGMEVKQGKRNWTGRKKQGEKLCPYGTQEIRFYNIIIPCQAKTNLQGSHTFQYW